MAVTLTTANLIQPHGELSPHFFPQSDLTSLVIGWLQAATTRVESDSAISSADHDTAAEAWVYYRAYDYIANQLAALPSQVSEGDGAISVSYAVTQFRYYQDKAAEKLAAYEATRSASSAVSAFFGLAHGRRGC